MKKKNFVILLAGLFFNIHLFASFANVTQLSLELVSIIYLFVGFFLDFVLLYRMLSKFDLYRGVISLVLLNVSSTMILYSIIRWGMKPSILNILLKMSTIIAIPVYILIPVIGKPMAIKLFKAMLVGVVAGFQVLLGVVLFSLLVYYINKKQLAEWLFLSKLIISALSYYFVFIY